MFERLSFLVQPPHRASSMTRVVQSNGKWIPISEWRREQLEIQKRMPSSEGESYDYSQRRPASQNAEYDFSQRIGHSRKSEGYDFTQ
jgi:hypothetical protein